MDGHQSHDCYCIYFDVLIYLCDVWMVVTVSYCGLVVALSPGVNDGAHILRQ